MIEEVLYWTHLITWPCLSASKYCSGVVIMQRSGTLTVVCRPVAESTTPSSSPFGHTRASTGISSTASTFPSNLVSVVSLNWAGTRKWILPLVAVSTIAEGALIASWGAFVPPPSSDVVMGRGVPSGNPAKPGLTASMVVTCTLSGSVSVRIVVAHRATGAIVARLINVGGGVHQAGSSGRVTPTPHGAEKETTAGQRFGAVPSIKESASADVPISITSPMTARCAFARDIILPPSARCVLPVRRGLLFGLSHDLFGLFGRATLGTANLKQELSCTTQFAVKFSQNLSNPPTSETRQTTYLRAVSQRPLALKFSVFSKAPFARPLRQGQGYP